jgi:hypothetical protein
MLIVPVTLVICSELKVRRYPFLFAEIIREQHWRNGDSDRRSAQHSHRARGGPHIQRLCPGADAIVIVIFAVQDRA